ncbi:hypothetical protein HAX54_018650 [Datura stramonium]|uniref:Uncharacterized protein n=1 Tax=Datura stramonium TaxID=4076 RepID=A0ABS8UQ40_DATST|nr:hypothetical protein [Datura stramonium]
MAGETSPSPSIEGNQLSDNLILDAPLSSNPSSSSSGTDTQPTLSSEMHSPKAVPVNYTVISPRDDNTGGDEAGVAADSPVVAKEGTDVPQKEGSDFSTENLFEGALTELKEARHGDPWTSAPSEIAAGTSLPPDDDEVPIHMIFKRKSRTTLRLTLQRSIGTQKGPSTRGTVKKSLDLILEESRQNTLKRRRVTRKTVLDKEVLSSPIVDLDTATTSQPTDESPNTEKKAHRSGGVSKKGKKLAVVEKPVEGPSAPVLRFQRKHFIAKSSKGKCTANAALGDDVKERVANIRKQKRRGIEEIERLTMLVEIAVLKASQSSAVPGALLDLREENALLKSDNVALRKQLEELTQQMICDQRAANERIDKLLAKL